MAGVVVISDWTILPLSRPPQAERLSYQPGCNHSPNKASRNWRPSERRAGSFLRAKNDETADWTEGLRILIIGKFRLGSIPSRVWH